MNSSHVVTRHIIKFKMFKSVRYLNPRGCDRITDLTDRVGGDIEVPSKLIAMIAALATIKPDVAKEKLDRLLDKLEKQATKDRFNLILKGLPDAAPLRDTGVIETIGYPHMRDTLNQFGKFTNMQIVRGTVYVKFVEPSSCVMCHSLVNKMQIGTNIVTTECI